ncbi:hypothetical protein DSO57_1037355 [Entomophthora muscae]|uniref:Uncharacterized protein n=1 Tax=Entomophthora muscae TaxID=34485 RepID=A0ACC2SBQ8_9FUNG|nr:hypothetical protein DSO57_1037355 [Entomophthora muscae]
MIWDSSTLATLVPGLPDISTPHPIYCGVYLYILCAGLLCRELQEIQHPHQGLPVVNDCLPNCHCLDWLLVCQSPAIPYPSSTYNVWVLHMGVVEVCGLVLTVYNNVVQALVMSIVTVEGALAMPKFMPQR